MQLKRTAVAAMVFGLCVAAESGRTDAQARFEVLTQETITEVSGLRVVTIRDKRLEACYTLFIMEPSASPPVVAPAATQDDESRQQSVDRMRDAAEKHDRAIADLNAQFEARVGRSHEAWLTSPDTGGATEAQKYELERMRIDEEYERTLRREVPGSYPWKTLRPGMRTGGWEDAAEAMRRSITNPDPTQARTLADPGGLNSILEAGFQRLLEAPRLAATGPASCGDSQQSSR